MALGAGFGAGYGHMPMPTEVVSGRAQESVDVTARLRPLVVIH